MTRGTLQPSRRARTSRLSAGPSSRQRTAGHWTSTSKAPVTYVGQPDFGEHAHCQRGAAPGRLRAGTTGCPARRLRGIAGVSSCYAAGSRVRRQERAQALRLGTGSGFLAQAGTYGSSGIKRCGQWRVPARVIARITSRRPAGEARSSAAADVGTARRQGRPWLRRRPAHGCRGASARPRRGPACEAS